jgi:hypothetical protein
MEKEIRGMQVALETHIRLTVNVKEPYWREEACTMPIAADRGIPHPGVSLIPNDIGPDFGLVGLLE